MAKLERRLQGDFNTILNAVVNGVLHGSVSAQLEDSVDWQIGNVKCAVRVFERYSWLGGNRVSMNVTMLAVDGSIRITAITSGGSQAMFFKINTFGERAFLDTLEDVINDLDTYDR